MNKEGSGDMYAKGANLVHMLRKLIGDDKVFKDILRGLNRDFYHKTVTTKDVEKYINQRSGKDFSKVFDQYLRTANLPVLEYRLKGSSLSFRWTNCVKGFNMRVRIFSRDGSTWIAPKEKWQSVKLPAGTNVSSFSIDKNFYIETRQVRQ